MTVRQLMNRLAKLSPKAEVVIGHHPYVFSVKKCDIRVFQAIISTLPDGSKHDRMGFDIHPRYRGAY